jgi:ligand-binding SRPBCC domain-containing protein
VSGAMWFERVSRIDCTPAELGEWHFRAGAIHRLVPPWESIEVVREASPLVDGAIAEIRIRKGPIATTLVAIHEEVERPRQFVDRQQRGPFGSWRHTHRFDAGDASAHAPVLRDTPHGSSWTRNISILQEGRAAARWRLARTARRCWSADRAEGLAIARRGR